MTKPAPAITVIVCCYNAAQTIEATLDSLNVQSFADYEILAIDDGSQDTTVRLLHDRASQHTHLRVLENTGNLGTAATRQRGLEEARAELVLFFDADDLALPNMLERLFETYRSDPDIMGVSCYAEYFDGDQALGVQKVGAENREDFFWFYDNSKLYFQSVVTLCSRQCALAAGGFRRDIMPNAQDIRYEDYAEDLDLWCRMSDFGAQGHYFLTLPEVLFRYRKPLDSLSTRNLSLMQIKMRWIKDCLRRRRAGQPERTLANFIASRTAWQRFSDWRGDEAAGFYKRAGFAYARRNFLALGLYLALAGVLSPKLIRQKIASQRVRG
ncbi:MAG: glycosyltransferase family 2 protein [Novosphingobium sp.]|nr:glycosyltransferase family 2 protein [Novosphingobium sp.]